ncbi:MAG: translocation/assembly module TamB domain-containing protein [Alistipes sp.]|nr:translocation/assembly module TamB domain-containing protein [Alistipes sp.]
MAKVLSAIILLLIFLPISVTLLLNLEEVQNVVVRHATDYVSQALGSRVSIRRIDMDLFTRVRVEGFYVEDYECDTLLYADKASASLMSFNVKRDGLQLSNVEASGVDFYLREMADGELNIRPIIAKLQNPEKESDFRLYMDDVKADDVQFRYTRLQPRYPEYGMDYGDIHILNAKAHVENFSVVKGAVRSDIRSFEADERSGLRINALSGVMLVDRGVIHVDDLKLRSNHSTLNMPRMHINGESWLQYKDYINSVQMDMEAVDSSISSNDIGYFAPRLRTWGITLDDVDVEYKGTVVDFEAKLHGVDIGENSRLRATAHVIGMPEWRTAKYIVGVEDIYLTAGDATMLINAVVDKPLPERVMQIVEKVAWVESRATFGGRLDAFRVAGNFNTALGRIREDVNIAKSKQGRYGINGSATSYDFKLGALLDQPKIGKLNASVDASCEVGSMSSGGVVGDVDVAVESFDFAAYTYRDIGGVGLIDGNKFYGEVNSADPNLEFDMYADVDFDTTNPYYRLSMMLMNADLHALGLNRRDEVSSISANIGVDVSGATLEELNGYVSVADAEYHYPGGDIYSNRLRIDLDSSPQQKYVQCKSDFFDFDFRSRTSYRDIYKYLYNSLMTYVPLLYNNSSEVKVQNSAVNNASDYTVFTLTANEEINSLLDAIAGGLVVAPETNVSLTFNPRSNNIILKGKSEAVEYSGLIMANVELDINNSSRDSMSVRMRSEGIYRGATLLMPNFNLNGGARENRVTVTAGFKDSEGKRSAMLGVATKFSRNARTNRRSIHVDITPSHFTTDSSQWKLYARGVDIDSTRVDINDLRISHGDELLSLHGVASRQRTDSIKLTLNRFNISPLSQFIARWGYDVGGALTGYATIKSALNNPEIEARIGLDELLVNGMSAPPQDIISDWDFQLNRARVFICDRATRDTLIRGYYQPDGTRYYANARVRGLKAALIQPFLKGIVSDIEGDVTAYATIRGEGRKAQLEGRATIDSLAMTVDYTKVRYSAPYGELRIADNHIYADGVELFDPKGNRGVYKMDLNLNHLSNVTYDISIDAGNILVLDTKSKDNDLFYGHVYATGSAEFRGDKRGLKMDIEATSGDNSHFYMPLSGKEDVSYADFVKFRTTEVKGPDTTAFLTRRMLAYERKHRPVNTIGSVMDIDMTLNALPNIDMQLVIDPTVGDIIQGRGTGQLTMHIVPKANIFEMRGEYTISDGNYLFTLQNIWQKLFTVVPGSTVSWNGDPMGAQLNIDAVYQTKASLKPLIGNSLQGIDTSRAVPVECYIKLTDDMMSPTVTFDVEVPNVAPEIQTVIDKALNDQQSIATQMFWLLAANTFSSEDTGAMGASLSATTGFELLSNQLSNWLSGDNYNIVLRYRPRTEQTGDEVDFGFSKSWLDNRLIVEVEGGYLSDEALQATEKASNFVGEAFITWLIDPDGAFRLKGFTQTIDRYGENQGMQESGVGVYYSESFNTFAELGESLKNRFRRDSVARAERVAERKERRASRREARDMLKQKPPTTTEKD